MTRPPATRSVALIACAALVLISPHALPQDDVDYHFRAFAIEPADRVPFGSGHAIIGVDRSRHGHDSGHVRTASSFELTLGLPADFSVVLESEARPGFSGNQPPLPGEQADRAVALKYSLPERDGLHLALVVEANRSRDQDRSRLGYSVVATLDSEFGDFGAGLNIHRRHPDEPGNGREIGFNWFRLGPSGWGVAAELRVERTPEDRTVRHALVGIAYRLMRGVMLDAAARRATGARHSSDITFGASFFF